MSKIFILLIFPLILLSQEEVSNIVVYGCKILDNDCDGVFSDGDVYLPDWTINWDNGYEMGYAVTGDDGCYNIYIPLPTSEIEWDGTIVVSEVLQEGYVPHMEMYEQTLTIDSEILGGEYQVDFFNCPATETNLCGYKYIDVNCNCILDSLDYTYEGWPMNLWWDDGMCPPTLIHTEVTDENGYYCFNLDSLNLNNNYTYMLAEEIPGGSASYPSIPGYAPCEPGPTGFGCAFSGGAPIYNINGSLNVYESNYITQESPNGEGSQIITSEVEHNFFNCIPCEVVIQVQKYIHEINCSTSFGSPGENWDMSLVSFNGDTLLTINTNNEGSSMFIVPCDSLEAWTTNGPISIIETMQPNYISCPNEASQYEIYYETVSTVPPLSSSVGTYDENGVFVPQTIYEFHNLEINQSYNCISSACVDPGDGTGTYSSLADCQAMCNTWNCNLFEDGTNSCVDPGDGTGQYVSLVDCEYMCNCELFNSWPISDPTGGPSQNAWCEWCLDYQNNPNQPFNLIGANWGDPDVMCSCCYYISI